MLMAVGVWLILAGEWFGWLAAIFFGLCAIVLAATLLPNSSYLQIGPEGFAIRSLYRTQSFRWSDVGPFVVRRFKNGQMVMFDFSEEYSQQRRLRELSKALAGHDGGLVDSYGLSHDDLAALLNRYREAAIEAA
jgi:hypothetical protein